MPDSLFQWDGQRITIRIGARMEIRNARVGVCVDGRWAYPFEQNAELTPRQAHRDAIGCGRVRRLIAERSDLAMRAELHFVTYDDTALHRVWLTLTNLSQQALQLDAVHLLEVAAADGGSLIFGDDPRQTVVYVDSGHGCFAGTTRLHGPALTCGEVWTHLCPPASQQRLLNVTGNRALGEGDHSSPSGLMVFSSIDRPAAGALLFGFAPVERALCTILCRSGQSAGVEYHAAVCGLFGYALPPGATYVSEDLLLGACADGLEALAQYATASARLRDIRISEQPLPSGWISWYGYRLEADEQNILANARIIAERFLPYGMDLIQPDYCWQKDFVANETRETNNHFPHGMAWLAQQIQDMGLRIGFWASPVAVSSRSDLFREHPEFLLKDEAGKPVVIGNWTWGHKEPIHVLDPTIPGALDESCEQLALLREATGSRYWKLDFMMFLLMLNLKPRFADARYVPGVETYRLAVTKLREALGDDFIYFCSNFPYAEWGIGDTTTTAADIGNPCFSKPSAEDNRIYGLEFFRRNATTILSRHFLHRRLVLLNADTANVGPDGDLREARLRFSLVAFSGGQFFTGEDLTRYPEQRLALVEQGLPAYGRAATPVDMFHTPLPDHPHIWRLAVETAWDQWDVLCLVNMTDKPHTVTGMTALPGLRADDRVFDFWNERPLGCLREHDKFELTPLESRILCVRECKPHPHLLATNLHYTQGGVEALEHEWDLAAAALLMTLRRRPGAAGSVWVTMPPDCEPARIQAVGATVAMQPLDATLLRCDIQFDARDAQVTIYFQ